MIKYILYYVLIGIAYNLTNWILSKKEMKKVIQKESQRQGIKLDYKQEKATLFLMYLFFIFAWPTFFLPKEEES